MLWTIAAQGLSTTHFALLNLSPNNYSLESKCSKFGIGPWETRMHQCDPPYNLTVTQENRVVLVDKNYTVLAVAALPSPNRFNCELGLTCEMLQAGTLPTPAGQSLFAIVRVYGQHTSYHFYKLPLNQTQFDYPSSLNRVRVPGEERLGGGFLYFQARGHQSGRAALVVVNCTSSTTLQILFSRSTDFGQSWSPLQVLQQSTSININNRLLSVTESGRLFLAFPFLHQPFQLKYSDDFGITWATSSLSLNISNCYVSEVASLDSNTLAISQLQYTNDERTIRIALSPDNGKSWSTWQPTSISFKDNNLPFYQSISLIKLGKELFYMYRNQQAQIVLAKADLRSASNTSTLVRFLTPGALNCGSVTVHPLLQVGNSRIFLQFDCYPRNGGFNSLSFLFLDLSPEVNTQGSTQ